MPLEIPFGQIGDFGQNHDGSLGCMTFYEQLAKRRNFDPRNIGKEAINSRYNGAYEQGDPAMKHKGRYIYMLYNYILYMLSTY